MAKKKDFAYYKGSNPGDTRRIKTGDENWDSHTFVTSDKEGAKSYGSHIDEYEAAPDAKILHEGTKEFRSLAKGVYSKDSPHKNLLEASSEVTKRAKAAGYHAVHFKRQTDIGTAILDPSKFKKK